MSSVEEWLSEGCVDPLVAVTAEDEVLAWNWGAELVFGWTAAEAVGKRLADLVVPADARDEWRHRISEALTTGTAIDAGSRVRKGGAPVETEVFLRRVESGTERAAFVVVHHRDVTEHRRLVQELLEKTWTLEESEERFRKIFLASGDGVLLADPADGRVLDANPRATEVIGRAHGALVGSDFSSLFLSRPALGVLGPLPIEAMVPRRGASPAPVTVSAIGVTVANEPRMIVIVRPSKARA